MIPDDILSKFFCYVLRKHVWKRAVRVDAWSGTQRCRWCPATRTIALRRSKGAALEPELVRTPTPPITHVVLDTPRSQWPAR